MDRIIKYLVTTGALRTAVAVFAAALLSHAAYAEEETITFQKQKVVVSGAKWKKINEGADNEELLLVFEKAGEAAKASNYFVLPYPSDVRILAVGGGGAGGTVQSSTGTSWAGGGGGGGGEVVEREAKLEAQKYFLCVGEGGAATGDSSKASSGANGAPSYVTGETSGEYLRVLGGGGGGGQAVGLAGGSGGGSSAGSTAMSSGGSANCNMPDGKASAGGGSIKRYAGGGGGAGGEGKPGTSSGGGAGGVGWASDIEGLDDPKEYGGGGGGGTTYTGKDGGLGQGGGGNGGKAANNDSAKPTDGKDGLGGGGGGGGRYKVGAKGGSGVIIIRISYIDKPTVWKEIKVRGGSNDGTVYYDENADARHIDPSDPSSDVIITYTNVNVRGGLKVGTVDMPVWANARVLVIGGGGGGGLITERRGGAGGGGGAGGAVAQSGLVFDNSVEFQIVTGRGGAGGVANEEAGGDGQSSSILTNGVLVVREALGGGGGGAHGDGRQGASGGGASRGIVRINDSFERAGGAALQGYKGGDATTGMMCGAGGGGAGGVGGNAELVDGVTHTPGNGGLGVISDISGRYQYYAGGGGGAFVNYANLSSPQAGGRGGSEVGGRGAGVEGGVAVAAGDGAMSTGSGGGGGISHEGAAERAGNGADGVVIIRLSGFVVKNIPLPEVPDWDAITYDGNAHTGVVEFFAYKLSGNPVATNSDVYSVTATIAPDAPYGWGDVDPSDPRYRGDRIVSWRIKQLPVDLPGSTMSFVYDAKEHTPVDLAKFRVNADGFAHTSTGLKYCQLFEYMKTDAAEYNVRATLVREDADGKPSTNFIWKSTMEMDDRTYPWWITQAPNAIVDFYYDGYSLARIKSAHHPLKNNHFDAKWGKSGAIIEYRAVTNDTSYGEWTPWGASGPTAKGNYELRVTIEETANWQGDQKTLPFGAWASLSDIFGDQMVVTVAGNKSDTTELKNFPVPVKFYEPEKDGFSVMSGFSFLRAGSDGKSIHFFDSNGDPIPHEVERWNTRSRAANPSVVWVRVPSLKGTSTKVTAGWKRVSDIRLPPYDGASVWRDNYCGVWHMSQFADGKIADATGNNRNAYLTGGAESEFIDGPMGKSLYVKRGDLLVDDWPYKVGTLTNRFTFSSWYRYPDFVADNKITGGHKMFAGTKLYASSTDEMKTLPGWAFRMRNAQKNIGWETTGQDWGWDSTAWDLKTTWGYMGVRAAYLDAPRAPTTNTSTKVVTYYGRGIGRYYASADTFNKGTTDDVRYFVNGSDKPLQLATAGFYVDEARLSTNTFTEVWMNQEYNSLHNKDFCTYDLVQIDCDKYNSGKGLACDWWTTVPKLSKTVWKQGEAWASETKGTYKKAGSVSVVTYTNLLGGAATTTHPTAVGYYRAIYDHATGVRATYRPQAYTIDFYIIQGVDPSHDLGEAGGASGRILLMNADNNAQFAVTNQGWCANDPHGVTYWNVLGGGAGRDNIQAGTSFELVRGADGARLWYLAHCRQGNTFPTNDLTAISAIKQIYLPASSSTALAITNESVKAGRADTGWVLMRNTIDAAIYSPCYTNGIGTIYFDAVNSTNALGSAFDLVLEIATETEDGLPPTDANSWTETSPGTTNWYGRLETRWRPVAMSPSRYRGSTSNFTDLTPTNRLSLAETQTGKLNYFYRVHTKVNVHKPVRFRIRRVTEDVLALDDSGNIDFDASYLLLDNLIVSRPPVYATLKPYGAFDPALKGESAVGMGGAFATPFPAAADLPMAARCRVELPAGAEETAAKDPDDYISLAQMFYRWRYLGQVAETASADADGWAAIQLKGAGAGAMKSELPLDVPARAGDLEFYFVSMMKSPFYGYTDYTGLNIAVSKAGYSEEVLTQPSRYTKTVSRLASGGEDWFTRIREARSDYEQMKVVLRGAVGGEEGQAFPMKLVEDNVWRAAVQIPEEATGECKFSFVGYNRQVAGSTEYVTNKTAWGVSASQGTVTLPGNGILGEGGPEGVFTIDHIANYVEFRIRSDGSPTWSASRAEYQNFNNWHDVWTPATDASFTIGTNGVDDVAMKKATADMSWWDAYQTEADSWNETFYLRNYNDPDYPKEKYFANRQTPMEWSGSCITFVSKNLGAYVEPSKDDTVSGLAAKLSGGGAGTLDFTKSSGPHGLERVTFTARLGQGLTFDTINYSDDQSRKQNYLFLAPVSMSRAIADNTKAGDMSVGAAVSLYAYYRASRGCYEFRVTRVATGAEVMMELYKWHPVNGAIQATRLCGQRQNADGIVLWNNSGEVNPKLYGFFISAKTNGDSVEIAAGVGKDAQAPTGSFSESGGAANGYAGLWYKDTDADRLVAGSYGVGAKDCPAQFIYPRHFDAPLGWSISYSGAGNCTTYPATTKENGKYYRANANKNMILSGLEPQDDRPDIDDGYWELNGQMEPYVNPYNPVSHHGLRTPVDRKQVVKLQIQAKSGGAWTTLDTKTVSGYTLESFTSELYRSGDWNLRLTTGDDATDVVIGEVHQVQWQGVDHEDIDYGSEEFVYTQGAVFTNLTRQVNETILQPARGVATKAMSVRSPLLNGLGKISFSYEDADEAAELWVQVATNKVVDNLYGTGGYNFSVDSVEKGQQAKVGEWITIAKYGASDTCDEPLGKSGVKTVYLGWHDNEAVPLKGLFRVFVPPSIVEKAGILATNATKNATYGKVSVTGMTVTDEPRVSARGWRGWNLRTVGDETDLEGRMFLADGTLEGDVGHGLVCALNNSLNDLREGTDRERAASRYPSICSPTLSSTDGARRSIGSVTFKARLYYADGVRETEAGGKVTVWGTTAVVDDPASWTKVKEFTVNDSVFSNFTWSANGVNFTAVKLEISDPATTTTSPSVDRVILDEVTVCEKVQASIGFLYARPFRTDLYEPVEIKDILSMNQQPLVGESWGVQTKLAISQMEGEVGDIEVYLTTYTGTSPWGYGKWKSLGTKPVRLMQIGETTNYVFRSVGTGPETIVKPVSDPNTVVQYMLIVKFRQESESGTEEGEQPIETWDQPAWYAPIDYNRDNGGYADPSKFSPYTILDTVSPGRAWINEVNWNDGPVEETHTTSAVVSNQFIEICVPSGIDMTGWYLRATDISFNEWTMAMFGQQMPARKVSPHAVNGFEFVVLESPETNYRGGIRDPEGNPAADGTWASDGPNGSARNGTLNYSYPFQLELVRPSGVVEHQIVVQGTNEWAEYSFGDRYYGTNLVTRLNERKFSAKRFYAGEETSVRKSGAWLGSLGVTGGEDDGDPAPGADGTWENGLAFTAGRLNEGQVIPKNWYLAPNGTNAWVYLYLNGSHLSQSIGGDTNRATMVIVPQGVRTNVTYTAEPWYEVASVTTKDSAGTRTEEEHKRGTWQYWFSPTGTVTITANESYDTALERYNIGEGKSAYSRAVINWLHDEYPTRNPADLRFAHYMNLNNTAVVTNLTLTEMYWFDIPPFNSTGNASEESEWWLRGGFTSVRAQEYIRKDFNGVYNTNNQFDVKLYISNAWNTAIAPYAPKRLQGLNNEKSDTYAGAWTSVTFKISGMLINGEEKNKGFLPFRMFTFGPDSFTGADAPKPFTATIEVLDPFSTGSPGNSYGWSKYPNSTPFWFKWSVDTKAAPDTVSVLKKEDVYEDVP